MASFKKIILALALFLTLLPLQGKASFSSSLQAQMLYWIHQGKAGQAFEAYLKEVKESSTHDFELLQQAALALLEEGSNSSDAEIQLLSLFGAGVSLNSALLPVLNKALRHADQRVQLTALHFLTQFQDDEAIENFHVPLSSPFLLVRLETIFCLAKQKDERTIECIHSLLVKVPAVVRPLFAQIVSPLQSPAAAKLLRQFLSDTDKAVRCEAMIQGADNGYDDLLPSIRTFTTHLDPAEQESCAIALGLLKDEASIPQLKKWTEKKDEAVRIASLKALQDIGELDAERKLLEEVRNKSLFAISLLHESPQAKEVLKNHLHDSDPIIRFNSALCLLKWKDGSGLPILKDILLKDEKDIGILEAHSPGKGLSYWKLINHSSQMAKLYPSLKGQTHQMRQLILQATLELSEDEFLSVAKMIFKSRQQTLIPLLVELLSNCKSEKAIQLLKDEQQKVGAPFIRNYCNLALFRLQEPGPYLDNLLRWVKEEQKNILIRFLEDEPADPAMASFYSLTPEETSQLLIQSFETLASTQTEKGIEALVEAIAYGNPKNRYALAGLVLRTAE